MHELPLLREKLLEESLVRTQTLAQLRMTQDAAEDERKAHAREMAALSKAAAEEKEQAEFQCRLLASQLEMVTRSLEEGSEELQQWRSGKIRLANAKNYKSEGQPTQVGEPKGLRQGNVGGGLGGEATLLSGMGSGGVGDGGGNGGGGGGGVGGIVGSPPPRKSPVEAREPWSDPPRTPGGPGGDSRGRRGGQGAETVEEEAADPSTTI